MYLWKGSVPPSSTFVADFFFCIDRNVLTPPPPQLFLAPLHTYAKIHTVKGRSDLRTPGDLQVQ